MPTNIFVIGLDELNLETLKALPDAADQHFHQLLTIEELQGGERIPLRELIAKADAQLRAFDGSIDAIVGYWDFPISSMVPILAGRFGTRSASLESVIACEHKYWARLQQQQVIPDCCPRFSVVDPFDDDAAERIDLAFPYWLKPVKAFSSELAHRIDGPDDLAPALAALREGVGRVGQPFDEVLSLVDLPPEVAEVGGEACLAEEVLHGAQSTVEGHCADGEVRVHGIVDSISYPNSSSFERFQYPSRLPTATQQRMTEVATRLIKHIGLQYSTFNIEFFWDPDTDALSVLEVNPRHSQSHAWLFEYVDGAPNHELMIDLALGQEPVLPQGKGSYALAAKWFLRRFRDGVVTRCPTDVEVAEAARRVPGSAIHLLVHEGDRLSELHDQDAYSYKLADVCVGADSDEELRAKYEACVEALPLEISDG